MAVATDVTAAVIKIIERTNPPAAGRAAHPGDDWAAGRRRGNRLGAPPGDRGIVPALKVVAPRARSATAATTISPLPSWPDDEMPRRRAIALSSPLFASLFSSGVRLSDLLGASYPRESAGLAVVVVAAAAAGGGTVRCAQHARQGLVGRSVHAAPVRCTVAGLPVVTDSRAGRGPPSMAGTKLPMPRRTTLTSRGVLLHRTVSSVRTHDQHTNHAA